VAAARLHPWPGPVPRGLLAASTRVPFACLDVDQSQQLSLIVAASLLPPLTPVLLHLQRVPGHSLLIPRSGVLDGHVLRLIAPLQKQTFACVAAAVVKMMSDSLQQISLHGHAVVELYVVLYPCLTHCWRSPAVAFVRVPTRSEAL